MYCIKDSARKLLSVLPDLQCITPVLKKSTSYSCLNQLSFGDDLESAFYSTRNSEVSYCTVEKWK